MIIPKIMKITPSRLEISSAEKRGPRVSDLSRRRKRENFSTTNPNAMMDIAVLIQARNVLSFARCVLLFPTWLWAASLLRYLCLAEKIKTDNLLEPL